MKGDTSIIARPPTSDDVLGFLQAHYLFRSGVDVEVEPDELLTYSTSIRTWRLTCDLVSTRRLAPGLNSWFGLQSTSAEWRTVLEPEDERTLGDLAAFVVERARWPDFAPLSIAGTLDAGAGAFFFLRGALARSGVCVADLQPSSRLEPHLMDHPEVLVDAIAKAAPGIMPEPRLIYGPSEGGSKYGLLLGAVLFAGGLIQQDGRWLFGALLLLGASLWRARGKPVGLEMGAFHTFGELARGMAQSRNPAA